MSNASPLSNTEAVFLNLKEPKESIPPANLARRAGTTTLYSYSVPNPHRLF
jgi:hypothetical protein